MTRHTKPRVLREIDRFPPSCHELVQHMWETYATRPDIVAALGVLGVDATSRQVSELCKRRGWQRPVDFNTRYQSERHAGAAATATVFGHVRQQWEGWAWPEKAVEAEKPPRKGSYFPNSGFSMLGGRVK